MPHQGSGRDKLPISDYDADTKMPLGVQIPHSPPLISYFSFLSLSLLWVAFFGTPFATWPVRDL